MGVSGSWSGGGGWRYLSALLVFAAFGLPTPAAAQEVSPPPDSLTSTTPPQGGLGRQFQLGGDQAIPTPDSAAIHRTIKSQSFFSSPTGALLRSVAIPGWGQWSNGKKQKAAVYFTIESYWITKSLIWRQRARDANNYTDYAHAKDRRNYFYWLTGITVFVSMFDAYADRYLLTLEKTRSMGDDFWGQATPVEPTDRWQLAVTVRF